MPQQTVYIRNEDMEAWKAIKHKALWIHEHLGVSELRSEPKESPVIIKTPDDVKEAIEKVTPTTVKYTNNWGA